ncbi:MAG: DUF4396 domain-containing protein [Nitrososphaeraceae archaeon]
MKPTERQEQLEANLQRTTALYHFQISDIKLNNLTPTQITLFLRDALFWIGLGMILPAGFAASYPAMYWAMRHGQQQELKKKQ